MEFLAGQSYYTPLTEDKITKNFTPTNPKLNTVYALIKEDQSSYDTKVYEPSYVILLNTSSGVTKLYTINIENYATYFQSYPIIQVLKNILKNQFNLVFTNPITVNNGFRLDDEKTLASPIYINDKKDQHQIKYTFYEKHGGAGANDVILEFNDRHNSKSNTSNKSKKTKFSSHRVEPLYRRVYSRLFKTPKIISTSNTTRRLLENDDLTRKISRFQSGGKSKKSTKRRR